jgi:hypothetical protein
LIDSLATLSPQFGLEYSTMTTPAAITRSSKPAFPLFQSLPPELRNKIWRDALPDAVKSAFFFYKNGLWGFRRRTEADDGYDAMHDELNWNFAWDYKQLDSVRYDVPLVFVNREARSMALDWIRDQGLKMRTVKDEHRLTFVRGWNPMNDILYVDLGQLEPLIFDVTKRFSEGNIDGPVTVETHVKHLAVSPALLQIAHHFIKVFDWFTSVTVLYVIIGEQPDPLSATYATRPWELVDAEQGAFVYDNELSDFVQERGKNNGDAMLYQLLQKFMTVLKQNMRPWTQYDYQLEIRPAFAVCRLPLDDDHQSRYQ